MAGEIHPAMQNTNNINRGFINPVENNMGSRLEAPKTWKQPFPTQVRIPLDLL